MAETPKGPSAIDENPKLTVGSEIPHAPTLASQGVD
jgi:hypothetical protein